MRRVVGSSGELTVLGKWFIGRFNDIMVSLTIRGDPDSFSIGIFRDKIDEVIEELSEITQEMKRWADQKGR